MADRLGQIADELVRIRAEQIALTKGYVRARRASKGCQESSAAGALKARIVALCDQTQHLEAEAEGIIGVSLDDLEKLVTPPEEPTGPQVLKKADLIPSQVIPTATIESYLAGALAQLCAEVDPKWLRSERTIIGTFLRT